MTRTAMAIGILLTVISLGIIVGVGIEFDGMIAVALEVLFV